MSAGAEAAPSPGGTVACIQARLGSTRLPGKVLLELAGHSVLSWVVRAVQASGVAAEVVVATTVLPEDDAVAAEARRLGSAVLRGPVDDVLARYVSVATTVPCDRVLRLTADTPLLDPLVVREVAGATAGGWDLVTTGPPNTLPLGFDVESISRDALARLDVEATGVDREHVTSLMYRPGAPYRVKVLDFSPAAPDLRVTLDTPEDEEVVRQVVASLGDRPPAWREVVSLLRRRPEVAARNQGTAQWSPRDG